MTSRTILSLCGLMATILVCQAQTSATSPVQTQAQSQLQTAPSAPNTTSVEEDNSFWTSSPILNLEPGKKIMKVADLDLAGNITLAELLQMFPELISRDDEALLSRFDLQIDDISVKTSKDVLLTQLRAAEIKQIEVSVNPATSSQIDGQGGVIKIKLNRPKDNGFLGNAMLEASTTWDVNPAFKFFYNKDKFHLGGIVSGQYYQPRDKNAVFQTYSPDYEYREYVSQVDDYKYGTQYANVHMDYAFNERNNLRAWINEGYSKNNHNIVNSVDSSGTIISKNNRQHFDEFFVSAGIKYKYVDQLFTFETELSYDYLPSAYTKYQGRNDKMVEDYYDNYQQHGLKYMAKGIFRLIPTTDHQKCEMTLGLNTNYEPKHFTFTDIIDTFDYTILGDENILDAKTKSIYVSPYLELNAKYGPCFFKGGVRYQFYQYDITANNGENFKKPQNKVTAFLNFGWQIAPHHHLSVILDKSLKRPDNQMVYPFVFYDPASGSLMKGNPDLRTEDIYTASLDYQYDFSKNGHTVLAGAGLRYNRVNSAISVISTEYTSYINDGYCDVINATAMAVYGKGPFKVFLTGNLLQNWSTISDKKNSNFSYNVALTPMLSFQGEWRVSGMFEYNSNIKTMYTDQGKYFYSEVRLNKGFKAWQIFMKLTDNFHRVVEDVEYKASGNVVYKSHYLHFPGFGLGASFTFGK